MHTDTEAILAANSNFYEAFEKGSAVNMEILWSNSENISCIHPGWPALYGQDDVISSWQCILNEPPPFLAFSQASAYMHGDFAYVVCCEHLEPGMLLATNIFANEDGVWKMIHHQSSICPSEGIKDDFDEFDNFESLEGPLSIQ